MALNPLTDLERAHSKGRIGAARELFRRWFGTDGNVAEMTEALTDPEFTSEMDEICPPTRRVMRG